MGTIVVQGGTFNNNAMLRCFELLTRQNVVRPDIAGIMGAFGSALIAKERWNGECDILRVDELVPFHIRYFTYTLSKVPTTTVSLQ